MQSTLMESIVSVMRVKDFVLLVTVLLFSSPILAQNPNSLTPREKAAGWHLLFDGKTTTGWHSTHGPEFPSTGWEVKEGLLSVTEHGGEEGGTAGDILSDKKYENFELSFDFRISAGANSGVKYFVDPAFTPGHEGHGSDIGFEYQILDDALHPDARKGRDGDRTVASLYDMIPAAKSKPTRPIGQWNRGRILIRGTHGEHWLNGVKVVEYDRASTTFRAAVAASKFQIYPHFGEANDGYILLQDHGFPVSFRNIKIRELPSANR
jgi:hypothetical protein